MSVEEELNNIVIFDGNIGCHSSDDGNDSQDNYPTLASGATERQSSLPNIVKVTYLLCDVCRICLTLILHVDVVYYQ
jgi:hypothetical protein